MGLDADKTSEFRIEEGTEVGTDIPLMVIKDSYLSVGSNSASANLHVSGNSGFIVEGSFEYFDEDVVTSSFFADLGTRFLFNPYNASFRLGTLDSSSPLSGEEWAFDNVGMYTIGMGYNQGVKGTSVLLLEEHCISWMVFILR